MFFLPVWKTLLLVLNIFFIEEQTDISSFARLCSSQAFGIDAAYEDC